MPLVGIQRRAWTATTLLPTFSAADANSLEIVSIIELAMSSKTPFLNCENRIEDKNLRRIRRMARWKSGGSEKVGEASILRRVKKALRAKLCQANANLLSQECVVGFDHLDPGYPAGAVDEIERHELII